jgi:GAF domain/ANTAR domain
MSALCRLGAAVSEVARRWDEALAHMARFGEPDGAWSDPAGRLDQVCGSAIGLLTASGAGIRVMAEPDGTGYTAASDQRCRDLVELQYTVGEGPCFDAFRTGRLVLVSSLSEERRRWPIYADAAREFGVQAVFAFPVQVGGSRLGVLDVFRAVAGPMSNEHIGRAMTLADIALIIILDGQQRAPAGETPDGFDRPPGFRPEIAQAQGMIMVQLGVTITEALIRLRAYAYAEGRLVGDVAGDVVARRLRFDRVDP